MGEQEFGLSEWTKVGMVSTGHGMLAIVAPCFAATLGRLWAERLDRSVLDAVPAFTGNVEEVKLEQQTFRMIDGRSYEDFDSALLFATDGNGGWDVEARFCTSGGCPPQLCELRLRLHASTDDEGNLVDDGECLYVAADRNAHDDLERRVDEQLVELATQPPEYAASCVLWLRARLDRCASEGEGLGGHPAVLREALRRHLACVGVDARDAIEAVLREGEARAGREHDEHWASLA